MTRYQISAPATPGAQQEETNMNNPRIGQLAEVCECGAAMGERCAGTLGDDAVEIEWMPEHLRESHRAAGNSGRYPHNGALRLRVTPECAALIADAE